MDVKTKYNRKPDRNKHNRKIVNEKPSKTKPLPGSDYHNLTWKQRGVTPTPVAVPHSVPAS